MTKSPDCDSNSFFIAKESVRIVERTRCGTPPSHTQDKKLQHSFCRDKENIRQTIVSDKPLHKEDESELKTGLNNQKAALL